MNDLTCVLRVQPLYAPIPNSNHDKAHGTCPSSSCEPLATERRQETPSPFTFMFTPHTEVSHIRNPAAQHPLIHFIHYWRLAIEY